MRDTKTEIISIAERLIRTRGYNGFSYKDISSALGIKNAAIHYHFPSKTDLGLAVIRHNRTGFERDFIHSPRIETEMEKLQKFFGIYQRSQKNGLVCIMGALGASYDSLPEAMQTELSGASLDIRSWLRAILAEGLQNGQFSFSGPVDHKADAIISSLLASLVMEKVSGEDILGHIIQSIQNEI